MIPEMWPSFVVAKPFAPLTPEMAEKKPTPGESILNARSMLYLKSLALSGLPFEDLLPLPPQPARKARALTSARAPTKRINLDLSVTRNSSLGTATAGADSIVRSRIGSILTDVFPALPLVRFGFRCGLRIGAS